MNISAVSRDELFFGFDIFECPSPSKFPCNNEMFEYKLGTQRSSEWIDLEKVPTKDCERDERPNSSHKRKDP